MLPGPPEALEGFSRVILLVMVEARAAEPATSVICTVPAEATSTVSVVPNTLPTVKLLLGPPPPPEPAAGAKSALTDSSPLIVSWQEPVPEQAPLQPEKTDPEPAAAVSVTFDPPG